MATTEKKGTKISEREALSATGEAQSDYTEAVKARFTHLETNTVVEWDFSHIESAIDRAFAIEGFLNKAGHAVNKAKNGTNASGDIVGALRDFIDNAKDGGWTNREGGNEVNLQAVLEAFAEFRGADMDRVTAAWAKYSDADKQSVRTNPNIRAIILRKRLEKAQALAASATASDMPAL